MSNNSANNKRIAIIGAGPIGLEAALYAVLAGYDPHVYDRGSVAANMQQWGHVKLFSPFGMNASSWGRETLATGPSAQPLPADDALLTGRQFVEQYLQPLSRLPQLAGRIHDHVRVDSISRSHHLKGDQIGKPGRAEDPFQLLLTDKSGERMAETDIVLDCSGTYGNHNWIGSGGIPCIGERQALVDSDYLLPDITGSDRNQFVGKTTLVAGSGYSAATAIVALASLAAREPQTRAIWVTRSTRTPPITPVAEDPLFERARLTAEANRLAVAEDSPVEWLPGRHFRRITRNLREPDAQYTVRLESNDPSNSQTVEAELTVDRVIANVGYRLDRTLYEELQIHECYASSGPMKLAAALLGETSADCTAQSSHGPETLRNPEPNLFILGAKSYGRDNRFLLQIGHQQITDVFSMIDQ
jgi:thioredoxin reductase